MEKLIKLRFALNIKQNLKFDPLDFFCRLSKSNLAPEAFMVKDKNFSIISCSPENLITKKGSFITTKPIAGTVKKTINMNKAKSSKIF